MKKFLKSLLFAIASMAGMFVLLMAASWLLQLNPLNLSGTPLLVCSSLLESSLPAGICILTGLLVFLASFLKEHGLLLTLVYIVLVCFVSSQIFHSLPDWQQDLQSQRNALAKQEAIEEAAAAIDYENMQEFTGYDIAPRILVVSDTEVSQEWIENIYWNCLAQMPDFLLEKCENIIFMDAANFEQEEMAQNLSNVVGLASSADMSVRILIQDFETPYIDKSLPDLIMEPMDYYCNTLCHELSHLYDYQEAFSDSFISDTEEFQTLYALYQNCITDYAATNIHEFFAECSKLYLLYPNHLYSFSPEVYAYFASLYAPYGY